MGVSRNPYQPGLRSGEGVDQDWSPAPRQRPHRPQRPHRRELESGSQYPVPAVGAGHPEQELPYRERSGPGRLFTFGMVVVLFVAAGGTTIVARRMMDSSKSLRAPEAENGEVPVEVTIPPVTVPQTTIANLPPTTHSPTTTETLSTTQPSAITPTACAMPADRAQLSQDQIEAIQQRYLSLGLYGEGADPAVHVDGIYGPNSQNAENAFQTDNGINPEQDWNAQTRDALFGCALND